MSPTSSLPVPSPHVTPETAPFWTAAADGRLLLLYCDTCGSVIWYPRPLCPSCHSTRTTWRESTGLGTIYSFTITRREFGAYRDAGPFVLAYVDLTMVHESSRT